ncbi:hypothetical protein ACTMTI_32300 [Nonomuraea sp. H19]|uniref:hypothetical protein n=1 Tax=Nonomuraea sp. H19 TaxID=3452206 RepID=UPI003F8B7498
MVDTGVPWIVWAAMMIMGAFGFAPQVAVQPVFYAELFGARVRYTGFAASRELGAALAGFSPLIGATLAARMGGEPWLVAAFLIGTAVISFVAFWASRESKDMDIAAADPLPGRVGED